MSIYTDTLGTHHLNAERRVQRVGRPESGLVSSLLKLLALVEPSQGECFKSFCSPHPMSVVTPGRCRGHKDV